jgi:hypothetical protein
MKNLLSSLVLVTIVAGCGGNRTYDLSDATQAETIILEKESKQGYIHSWSVAGDGNIDGEAEIVLMLNGNPYHTEKLSGAVDFEWSGDWYSDEAEIIYTPTSITGGSLSLSYKFND